jgi:hypothetical protein
LSLREGQSSLGVYLITVDIGAKRDRTSVVVSHRDTTTDDRPVVIDRIDIWKGTPKRPVSQTSALLHYSIPGRGRAPAPA